MNYDYLFIFLYFILFQFLEQATERKLEDVLKEFSRVLFHQTLGLAFLITSDINKQ